MAKTKKSNGEGTISYESDRKMYRARLIAPDGKRISKRFPTKKRSNGMDFCYPGRYLQERLCSAQQPALRRMALRIPRYIQGT